ncbi:MAG: spermidine synthase, partial [Verrucomicrobiales bacterium]
MKPTTRVAETSAPDGAQFVLLKHDGEFLLYMDDRQIMTTTLTHSELLLSDVGCDFKQPRKSPRVLIGGLGLGFSLRRALEITGPGAKVVVAELLPEIVRWNHEHLDGLNDEILADRRTEIVQADVYKLIKDAAKKGPKFDAILLDVDDGPTSLIQPQNIQLYGNDGLEVIK